MNFDLFCLYILANVLETVNVAYAINSANKGEVQSKVDRRSQLLLEAGCRAGATLLGKGACIEDDYLKGDAPNKTTTRLEYTFMSYEIVEIDVKAKKMQFYIMLIKSWDDDRIKSNSSSFVPLSEWLKESGSLITKLKNSCRYGFRLELFLIRYMKASCCINPRRLY